MSRLIKLVIAVVLLSYSDVDGFRNLRRIQISQEVGRSSGPLQPWLFSMTADAQGHNPVSSRQSLLSKARDVMISISLVAVTTGTVGIQQAVAETDILQAAAAAPVRTKEPLITSQVYLDIKIANYTEESTGTNKGAEGSGRVVFGLYGKDAPESVARVRISHYLTESLAAFFLICKFIPKYSIS